MSEKLTKRRVRRGSKKSVPKLRPFTMWFVIPMGDKKPDFVALNKSTADEMSRHPETGEVYCYVLKMRFTGERV